MNPKLSGLKSSPNHPKNVPTPTQTLQWIRHDSLLKWVKNFSERMNQEDAFIPCNHPRGPPTWCCAGRRQQCTELQYSRTRFQNSFLKFGRLGKNWGEQWRGAQSSWTCLKLSLIWKPSPDWLKRKTFQHMPPDKEPQKLHNDKNPLFATWNNEGWLFWLF